MQTPGIGWSLETLPLCVAVGDALQCYWHAPEGAVSAKGDFIAAYEASAAADSTKWRRHYIKFWNITPGLVKGVLAAEGAAQSPCKLVFRYFRADWTPMALSPAVFVKSRASALLDELQTGGSERSTRLLEHLLMNIKPDDTALQQELLDRLRAMTSGEASTSTGKLSQESKHGLEFSLSSKLVEDGQKDNLEVHGWENGLATLSLRATGFAAASQLPHGDHCRVSLGGIDLFSDEAGKAGAGLSMLVIRRDTLRVIFRRRYDTHHDSHAAEDMAGDLVSRVLQSDDEEGTVDGSGLGCGGAGSNLMIVVVSQFAWEGYFSSPELCDVLGTCGADRDALLPVQKAANAWLSSSYKGQPLTMVLCPGMGGITSLGSQQRNGTSHCKLLLTRSDSEAQRKVWLPTMFSDSPNGGWSWFVPPRVVVPPAGFPDASHPAAATLTDDNVLLTVSRLSEHFPASFWINMRPNSGVVLRVNQIISSSVSNVPGKDRTPGWRNAIKAASKLANYDWGRSLIFEEAWLAVVEAYHNFPEDISQDAALILSNFIRDDEYLLKGEVLSLGMGGAEDSSSRNSRTDVARCLMLRLGEYALQPECASKLAESVAIEILVARARDLLDVTIPSHSRNVGIDALLSLCKLSRHPAAFHSLVASGAVLLIARAAGAAANGLLQIPIAQATLRALGDLMAAPTDVMLCCLSIMMPDSSRTQREISRRNIEQWDGDPAPLRTGKILPGVVVCGQWTTKLECRSVVIQPADATAHLPKLKGTIMVLKECPSSASELAVILREAQACGVRAAVVPVQSVDQLLGKPYMVFASPDIVIPTVAVLRPRLDTFISALDDFSLDDADSPLIAISPSHSTIAAATELSAPQLHTANLSGGTFSKLSARCLQLMGSSPRTLRGKGLRILALDGGGTRGIVTLELLKVLQAKIGRPLSEVFDVIMGTSTGGILCAALYMHHMTLEEAGEMYERLSDQVFAKGWFATTRMVYSAAKYDATTLQSILQSTLGDRTCIEAGIRNPRGALVGLVSTLASVTPPKPFIWRSYMPPSTVTMPHLGTSAGSMATACRATSAAPSYFAAASGPFGVHVDGGCIGNSPVSVAVTESLALMKGGLWGEDMAAVATRSPCDAIEMVVSLGTGGTPPQPGHGAGTWQSLAALLVHCATETRRDLQPLFDLLGDKVSRLQPQGAEYSDLDNTDSSVLKSMREAASQYAEHNYAEIDRIAGVLKQVKDPSDEDLLLMPPDLEESLDALEEHVPLDRSVTDGSIAASQSAMAMLT